MLPPQLLGLHLLSRFSSNLKLCNCSRSAGRAPHCVLETTEGAKGRDAQVQQLFQEVHSETDVEQTLAVRVRQTASVQVPLVPVLRQAKGESGYSYAQQTFVSNKANDSAV